MFYRNTLILLLMFASTIVMAGGGFGDGGRYESSSDSTAVRKVCSSHVSTLKNGGTASVSDEFSKDLGYCLTELLSRSRRMTLNYTNCDMLEMAVAESCSGFWGLMGLQHKACVNERSNRIGRNPGWVYNYGYCHTACPTVNLPVPDMPPFKTPPCGLNKIPPNLDDISPNIY